MSALQEETKSVFERAKARADNPALADDRTNRFERFDENRAKILRTEAEQKSTAIKQRRDTKWPEQSKRGKPLMTPMTPELEELKRRERQFTSEQRNPKPAAAPAMVTLNTFAAVLNYWVAANAYRYPDSPFNGCNFNRCLSRRLQAGEAYGMELLDAVYDELQAGGYLEKKLGPRTRGDFVNRSAPREYPGDDTLAVSYLPTGEPQTEEDVELVAAKKMSLAELAKVVETQRKQARKQVQAPAASAEENSLPFDELQRRARAGFKPEDRLLPTTPRIFQ